MNFTINIFPRRVVKRLSGAAVGFLLAGVVSHSLKYNFNRLPALYHWLNTDGEKNFPAAFSSGLLLFCAVLLLMITAYKQQQRDRFTPYWGGLSIIFGALAIDEWLSFHERLSDIIRPVLPVSGIFHFAWIIGGIGFVACLSLVYWRFLTQLPARYRRLFLCAAGLFVCGAIGMEMVGGYYANAHQQWNRNIWLSLTTVEEGLEMCGTIVFIHALLAYLRTYVHTITICLRPVPPSVHKAERPIPSRALATKTPSE